MSRKKKARQAASAVLAEMDHETAAAISANLAETVYDAVRLAERQRRGLEPVPVPSGRAWGILARSREAATA